MQTLSHGLDIIALINLHELKGFNVKHSKTFSHATIHVDGFFLSFHAGERFGEKFQRKVQLLN